MCLTGRTHRLATSRSGADRACRVRKVPPRLVSLRRTCDERVSDRVPRTDHRRNEAPRSSRRSDKFSRPRFRGKPAATPSRGALKEAGPKIAEQPPIVTQRGNWHRDSGDPAMRRMPRAWELRSSSHPRTRGDPTWDGANRRSGEKPLANATAFEIGNERDARPAP